MLCVCVFSLVHREVDSEEDKGAGACSSAQSWALLQPQHDSCCNDLPERLPELWASHRGSHAETNIFVVPRQLTLNLLRTPIAQSLELLYLTLQCGQSSFALALCAAASALFKSPFSGPRGVGSTERAHRLISRSGGSSESLMRTWHDRWKLQVMPSHDLGWFLTTRSTERPSK